MAILLAAAPLAAEGPSRLVLAGGKVWTGDPGRPHAEAVAMAGERILAVGTAGEARAAAGEGARIVDLRGRRVVPGFIDAHLHFLSGGDELLAPDLRSARSAAELGERLGETARRLPAGTWIASGAWDHENWPGSALPTRAVIDPHTPRHPVIVNRIDGHMALANSLALELAGVTRDTPAPPGGEIVRDPATGEPTGILKDTAIGLVERRVPPLDAGARRERALAALRHAASLGVTGAGDMLSSLDALSTYQELRREGLLTVRLTLYAPLSSAAEWTALKVERGFGDAFLRLNGVKAFADGSLGASTALFLEPYVSAPGSHGLAVSDLAPGGGLEQQLARAMAGGLQPAVHAIGDRAIREVLDILERSARVVPGAAGLRFRVEHAQHIHPDDLGRFAKLGAVASMQPYHAADDGRWAEGRIGARRCETTYAFRDLLDRGARLAFGSDWPVAPLAPLLGIHAAVTRRTLDGKHPGGWVPRQKITVEEALRAYTAGSAHAAHAEGEVGMIRPGYLADLVVLSEDILSLDPARIAETNVDLTVVGGRVVYERTVR